jgi:serine/threonine protein kinase
MTDFDNLKQQIEQYVRTGMTEAKRQELLKKAEDMGINGGQLVMLIKNAELELKFATGISNKEYPTEIGSGLMTSNNEETSSGFVTDITPGNAVAAAVAASVQEQNNGSGFVTENSTEDNNASGFVNDYNSTDSDSGFSSARDSFKDQFSEIKKLESTGAMADLYSAIHLGRRKVIIKRIKEQYRNNKEYIDLFYKEFDTGYSLENTNIVHFYGKGEDEQGPYYYMEYVDGRTLDKFIHIEKNQQPAVVTKIVLQILDALKYMHQKQVFHRDLKPENIMLTYKGDNVKIIDFGLAAADSLVDNLTKAGTPKYSAPELLRDATKADQRTDIFSLGMMIIEIFTGSPDRRKLGEIKNSVYKEIADKATMMLPSDRYQSCDEIINVLSVIQPYKSQVANAPIPKWLEEKIKEYAADGVITRNERIILDKEIAKANADKDLVDAMINDEIEKAIQRKRNEEARRRMTMTDKPAYTQTGNQNDSSLGKLLKILIAIIAILAIIYAIMKFSGAGSSLIGDKSTTETSVTESFNKAKLFTPLQQ